MPDLRLAGGTCLHVPLTNNVNPWNRGAHPRHLGDTFFSPGGLVGVNSKARWAR